MALLKVKLFHELSAAALKTAVEAYQADDGSQLATDQRGMDLDVFFNPTNETFEHFCALAHDGLDVPATKTEDQQFLVLEQADGDLAALQTALDAALADAAHHTLDDGDADANAGDISVGSAMFAAADVGRKITIDDQEREITAYVSSTRVTYSGDAITGTGLDVTLHGAESLQSLEVSAMRERDGDAHFAVMLAVEGQAA